MDQKVDDLGTEPHSQLSGPGTQLEESEALLQSWYAQYFNDLSRRLNAVFGAGPPDPEDVAQRTFEKLLRKDNLSTIENVKAYLWHVARNTFLTEVRSVTRRQKLDFDFEAIFFAETQDSRTPERVLEATEQLRSIRDAFGQLPDDVKEAFVLHRIDGMSFSAIAKRMGVGRKRATALVTRAVLAIDDALES